MTRAKKGETLALMREAITFLDDRSETITPEAVYQEIGGSRRYIINTLNRLALKGELRRLPGRGVFAKGDGAQSPGPAHAPQRKSPLEEVTAHLMEIPASVERALGAMVELALEPEAEILAMLDRREKRIKDLESLLHGSSLEITRAREKISELQTKINRLMSEKNRVIPETKVVFRERR
jgi:hypothetical protein